MASITTKVEVCDVCRDIERPVRHFRLAPDSGRLRTLALCSEHSEPLDALVLTLNLWTGRGRPSKQVTMEQIEVVKRRGRPRKAVAAATN